MHKSDKTPRGECGGNQLIEWLVFGGIVVCLWGALFLIWVQMKRRGG